MGYTKDKKELDTPDWAEAIYPGDIVRWESASETGESEILGFSTSSEYRGLPVIPAPEHVRRENPKVEEVALTQDTVVGLVDVDDMERARRKVEKIQSRVVVKG